MQSREAEFGPPRPRYVIGFESAAGRVVRLADADALVWAQVQFIQISAALRAAGGGGIVVLVHVASGQVRERITVMPDGPPDD